MPCSRYFCPNRNINRGGISVISDAINDTPALSAVIFDIYNDSGQSAWFFKKACGASIAFQYSKNPNILSAVVLGFLEMSEMRKPHPRLPPP